MKTTYIKESLVLLGLLSGCSVVDFSSNTVSLSSSGSVTLSRPAPSQSVETLGGPLLLGFAPLPTGKDSISLKPSVNIQLSTGSITLSGSKEVVKAKSSGKIVPGTYKISLKQKNPTWYAPDNYFVNRGLEIPSQGSKSRILKGALGPQALFFGDSYSIHTSSVQTDEISGLSIDSKDIDQIFTKLEVGSLITISE